MLKSVKKKLTSDIVGNIENLFVGRHKSEHWFLQHKVVIAGKARVINMEMEKINDDIQTERN